MSGVGIEATFEDIRRLSSTKSFPLNHEGDIHFNRGMKRPSQPNEDVMSTLIAKELNQLSLKERSTLYEQLHGVAAVEGNESPEKIKELSEQVLQEVKRIRERSAFDKALFLSPEYVSDPDFLAMFLRAEDYNVKLAARRLVRHFHYKLELFGEERIGRPILYDDLDEDDKETLLSGRAQIIKERRDRAGRLIFYSAEGIVNYKKPIHQLRAGWYLVMRVLANDVDAQKSGFVMIRYCVDAMIFNPADAELKRKAIFLPGALPYKVMAYHFCYNNSMAVPAMTITQMLIGMAWRVRFRAHYGSYVECMYALMTFGIPKEALPVNVIDGTPSVDEFLADNEAEILLERERHQHLMAGMDENHILYPLENDVLLGRGRPYQEFSGNKKLALIIQQRKEEYQGSGKLQKTELTNVILHEIKASGGRFLKKSDDGRFWVLVNDDVAREKVSHGFRTKTKKQSESLIVTLLGLTPETSPSDSSDLDTSEGDSKKKKAKVVTSMLVL